MDEEEKTRRTSNTSPKTASFMGSYAEPEEFATSGAGW